MVSRPLLARRYPTLATLAARHAAVRRGGAAAGLGTVRPVRPHMDGGRRACTDSDGVGGAVLFLPSTPCSPSGCAAAKVTPSSAEPFQGPSARFACSALGTSGQVRMSPPRRACGRRTQQALAL